MFMVITMCYVYVVTETCHIGVQYKDGVQRMTNLDLKRAHKALYLDMGFETLDSKLCELNLRELTVLQLRSKLQASMHAPASSCKTQERMHRACEHDRMSRSSCAHHVHTYA